MSLTPTKPAVQQTAANAQGHADDICYPVIDVGAAFEAGLDEFNDPAEGARADEDRQQSDSARARQREGQYGEGDEVHQFVASLGRWGWRLQGPEHRDGQGERHGDCKWNVKVLAHPPGCSWGEAQRQARAAGGRIRG